MTTKAQITDSSTANTLYTRLHHPHSRTLWRVGWLIVAALTIAIYLATFPDSYSRYLRDADRLFAESLPNLGLTPQFYAAYFLILVNGVGLVCIVTAGVIFWRRSDDTVALLMSAAVMTFVPVLGGPASRLPFDQPAWLWPVIIAQIISSTCILVTFYLFPDRRFVPRWTRWLVIPFILWEVARVTANQGVGNLFPRLPIPTIMLTIVLWFGTDVYAQIYRYRRSSTEQRHQTRWVVFGFATAIFGLILFLLSELFIFPLVRDDSLARLLYRMFVNLFFIYGPAAVVPISLAVAILRYRLYDIDLIINRGLVYGALTLLLSLAYFAVVTVVQAITGQSELALAVSSLVIAFLFLPARRRLQNVVDRRFYGLRVNLDELAVLQKPKVIANPGALTGRILGAYQVEGVLGRGGMGEVYKGYQTGLNRSVAIKVLPPELAGNQEYRTRFEREAQTVATLRHPNIVQVFDFGSLDEMRYMVMEYLEGKELNDYLYEHSKLTLQETLPIIHDVAAALDYAHGMGLVHRDIKPSNVMLRKLNSTPLPPPRLQTEEEDTPPSLQTDKGEKVEAVLMDFGVTKWLTEGAGMTQTGVLGTLDYMAPEQIISARQVDHRADIYALGVMVYQMLTGKKPFVSDNPGQLLFAHLQQPPPDPRELCEDLPRSVAKAVMKAMAKKPEDRFQSAGEFAAALN